jgi:hypothetical protein
VSSEKPDNRLQGNLSTTTKEILMKRLPKTSFLCIALIVVLLWMLFPPASPANADMGPKPTMFFEFIPVEGMSNLLVLEGYLMECEDSACLQSHPLEDFGPQGFKCYGTTCHAAAYSFTEYHRLVLSFSDGITRESNVFTKNSFEANYIVTIEENDLVVMEGRGYPNPNLFFFSLVLLNILLLTGAFFTLIFLIRKSAHARGWITAALIVSSVLAISGSVLSLSLPATIFIELMLAAAYALRKKRPLLQAITLFLLANVITQFALWAALNTFNEGNAFLLTIGLEIIIWAVESLIIYLPQREEMQYKEAALLSLVLNLASFGIGLLLPI